MMKYARQIYAVKRKSTDGTKKTLAVDMHLFLPGETEDDCPMTLHAGYSRFVFILMNVNGYQKIIPKANFAINDVRFLVQKTQWCNTLLWKHMYLSGPQLDTSSSVNTNSPAYTCKIAGKFAQKTPAEILMAEGENGKQILQRHVEWLQKNGNAKYAKMNESQINAINDGIRLFNEGKLNATIVKAVAPHFMLFDSGRKFFRGEKKGDLFRTYQLKVEFDAGLNYPYQVTIQNSWNSVTVLEDGSCRIGGENVDAQSVSIKLSAAEWTGLAETMKARLEQFEINNFTKQSRIMEDNCWKPDSNFKKGA